MKFEGIAIMPSFLWRKCQASMLRSAPCVLFRRSEKAVQRARDPYLDTYRKNSDRVYMCFRSHKPRRDKGF